MALSAAAFILCQTTFFLKSATLRALEHGTIVEPIYGLGFGIYAGYFFFGFIVVIGLYVQDTRRTAGAEREELQFVLVACCVAFFGGTSISFLLSRLLENSQSIQFAPLRVILLSVIIAYGVATRRIMNVGAFIRRITAYSVLTLYLVSVYSAAWWIGEHFLIIVAIDSTHFPHLLAATAVALSMAPAHGLSRNMADRLLINSRGLDFRATVNKAAAILQSVSALPELLERFAGTIAEAVGTDTVVLLLMKKSAYTQFYPAPTNENKTAVHLTIDDPVIKYLVGREGPIVRDELHRIRATPELTRVKDQMQGLGVAVAMGIFYRQQLTGIMLLGPRLSGRIYGTIEQNALQVLCGQLAVAIENAELFTQVQNAKIYNDVLLENLTTGVVAASADGTLTVFNREAEQITQLNSADVIGRPLDNLPIELRQVMQHTLRSGEREKDRELSLHPESEARAIITRAGSSNFRGQDGHLLGVLMVLTDITALKRLEQQIRRNDRLASLGTLSAGMAHEIKNPLVSIKTFTQLLPERYQDPEFRETFSNLIGHEVDRIDGLVNQLLRFARPAKPRLTPTHVHEVIEKSLLLIGHRLYQKDIKLTRSLAADVDTIRADADQLEQVFLNFFINAMDAMSQAGELRVLTCVGGAAEWIPTNAHGEFGGRHDHIRITIEDNGGGIRQEHIAQVFDPFFTTKDYGTGLGLSVVHGIVQEHGGQIEVESELQKGTAFHILLPLARFDQALQEVAAA